MRIIQKKFHSAHSERFLVRGNFLNSAEQINNCGCDVRVVRFNFGHYVEVFPNLLCEINRIDENRTNSKINNAFEYIGT